MGISRGEPWGEPGSLPPDAPIASSDAQLAQLAHDGAKVVGLIGGDIWRAVGAPAGGAARLAGTRAHRAPIDLVRVTTEQQTLLAAAHVVARMAWRRGGWLRGDAVLVASTEWVGRWKVAPAAHPNDGWAHVTSLSGRSFPIGQRLTASRRARNGDHLPHPAITARRARSSRHSFERATALVVDGARRGTVRSLVVEVVPDAVEIVF